MKQPNTRIYIETLEEIAGSDDLMNAFADETERYYYVPAPRDFASSLKKRSQALDIQAVAKTHQASRKLQLFIYSLRVGTAVAGALLLLFALPSLDRPGLREPEHRFELQDSLNTRSLSDSLSEFSYEIFDWR